MIEKTIKPLWTALFPHKVKMLGTAERVRRYDLPLDNDSGSRFLIILSALMSFLMIMAFAGALLLGSLTQKWSSGLENQLTIEIAAYDDNGDSRTASDMNLLTEKIQQTLRDNEHITIIEIIPVAKIEDLIKPWMDGSTAIADMPLPALIGLELSSQSQTIVKNIQNELENIASGIRLDTHEDWLDDLLRAINILRICAILIALTIAAITVIAMTSAVRARMDVHREDVQLLHLMGASDPYIAKQFQRHAITITIKGTLIGLACACVILLALATLSGTLSQSINFTALQIIILLTLPFIITAISSLIARRTVLHTLRAMP